MMRTLGATGVALPAIGYGAMGLDFAYGRASHAQGRALIRRAVALGAGHIDTADLYGPHTNEQRVGRAIAGLRDQVVLSTKGGQISDPSDRYAIRCDGRPRYLRGACEASLNRLGVDHVDLYYLHRVDPDVPIEESVGALAELVVEGKIRAIGLSETDVATLARAHAVHPISALQSELSLWTRGSLDTTLPWCREHHVTFVSYSPLGRGFLTGRYRDLSALDADDFRRTLPRFQREALSMNLRIVDAVEQVAADLSVPAGNVALAWVLAQGDHVVAIPGTKRTAYLEENVRAADLTLSTAERATLDQLPAATGAAR
jgi:aryl-alcohol dehydrogenase-like predicted oxidoreductase